MTAASRDVNFFSFFLINNVGRKCPKIVQNSLKLSRNVQHSAAGGWQQNTKYCISPEISVCITYQTSRLPPTNVKSYGCVSLSKANKSASKILFFAHSSINFSGKKITKLPSAEHRGLSKSEVRIASWKTHLPNESEESKRVFQDEDITSGKK